MIRSSQPGKIKAKILAQFEGDFRERIRPNWHLEEAVSREQALAMLTRGGAYAAFAENERGTIEVGKRADLSCFSADLITCPVEEIPRARPVLTLCDGEITYKAP